MKDRTFFGYILLGLTIFTVFILIGLFLANDAEAQGVRLNKPLTELGFTGLTSISFQARIATTSFCAAAVQGDPDLDLGDCFTIIAPRNCAEAASSIRADYDVDELMISSFVTGCLFWLERDTLGILEPLPDV